MPLQSYTEKAAEVVTAFQTPWPMTITVNGKQVIGNAGEWLVVPPNNAEPFFLSDIAFETRFAATV